MKQFKLLMRLALAQMNNYLRPVVVFSIFLSWAWPFGKMMYKWSYGWFYQNLSGLQTTPNIEMIMSTCAYVISTIVVLIAMYNAYSVMKKYFKTV